MIWKWAHLAMSLCFARLSTISSHLIESLCAYTILASHCWINIIYSLSIFICCVCLMPMHSFIWIYLICFIVKFVRVPYTHHKIHATKKNRKNRKSETDSYMLSCQKQICSHIQFTSNFMVIKDYQIPYSNCKLFRSVV